MFTIPSPSTELLKMLFIPQVTKELKNLNKKIVECTWDAESNQWKFLRVRDDKSFPNGYNTALSELAFLCTGVQDPCNVHFSKANFSVV